MYRIFYAQTHIIHTFYILNNDYKLLNSVKIKNNLITSIPLRNY